MTLTEHTYEISTRWSSPEGTTGYRSYSRVHSTEAEGPGLLEASADPAFHGDRDCWNPEQLLVSALSSCHMLSFLHEAVREGVVVTSYEDEAIGTMAVNRDRSGQFERVLLRPRVATREPVSREVMADLHHRAHEVCFLARSVNFPVEIEPAASRPEQSHSLSAEEAAE